MIDKTIELLRRFQFRDDTGELVKWVGGQIEIIDCIVNRQSPNGFKRVQTIASTQYGKSLAVGAGLAIRASTFPEKWSIVAGTKEKARIIMEYVTMFSLNNPAIRSQLDTETPLDRLRMKKSQDRLGYKNRGEVRVFSADATRVAQVSKSLMGFGSPNVVEDESALIPDTLQATVMRMLGGHKDNFLMKIGNPFNRNHFLRTWLSDRYYKIFIDYERALKEGRFSPEFIDEMKEEAMFDILYGCKFPNEGMIDEKGWIPLLTDSEVERAFANEEDQMFGIKRLGCDVAGGGRNYSVMVVRGFNLAKKIYKKNESDTMRFAGSVIQTASELQVQDRNIFVDKVGIGRGAFDKLKSMKDWIIGVNGGDSPVSDRFFNLRAEMYWRAREWILHGGKLLPDKDWYQLANVRYKVNTSGKLQIMSKEEMLRNGIDSPDVADSLAMTFARSEETPAMEQHEEYRHIRPPNLDPYSNYV